MLKQVFMFVCTINVDKLRYILGKILPEVLSKSHVH